MLAHHSTRKTDRYGELYLTNFQHRVLAAMNTLRLEGEHFVDLSDVKQQIVGALEKRGYIAPRSAARSEKHYRMTALGLEAYHVFQPPRLYRMDGLCPRCGEHPVMRYNGRNTGYCRVCLNAIKRDSRLHGNSKSSDAPCACCRCVRLRDAKDELLRLRRRDLHPAQGGHCRRRLLEPQARPLGHLLDLLEVLPAKNRRSFGGIQA